MRCCKCYWLTSHNNSWESCASVASIHAHGSTNENMPLQNLRSWLSPSVPAAVCGAASEPDKGLGWGRSSGCSAANIQMSFNAAARELAHVGMAARKEDIRKESKPRLFRGRLSTLESNRPSASRSLQGVRHVAGGPASNVLDSMLGRSSLHHLR